MARVRANSNDDASRNIPEMDPMLACSWPARTPSKFKPEPPRAPMRKPSDAKWDVPFMSLPMAPSIRKGSLSASTADTPPQAAKLEPDDEEEEDIGMFALEEAGEGDEGADEDAGADDDGFGHGAFQITGLGDDLDDEPPPEEEVPKKTGALLDPRRARSGSESPVLGASPTLLFALERVAQSAPRMGGR